LEVTTISGDAGSLAGSLLVPVTLKVPSAKPENASVTFTVATSIGLPFGGYTEQPGAGIPEITGDVYRY
jgi:hypothetical protein